MAAIDKEILQTAAGPRRSTRAVRVPDEVQRPVRRRFLALRLAKRKSQASFRSVSAQGIGALEREDGGDISKFRLGDLYGLAVEYGMTLKELLDYAFGGEDILAMRGDTRNLKTMDVYMRSLTDDQQELACQLVRTLVDFEERQRRGLPPVPLSRKAGTTPPSKDILEHAQATAPYPAPLE